MVFLGTVLLLKYKGIYVLREVSDRDELKKKKSCLNKRICKIILGHFYKGGYLLKTFVRIFSLNIEIESILPLEVNFFLSFKIIHFRQFSCFKTYLSF